MSSAPRVSDADLIKLLYEWDRLWSVWLLPGFYSPLFRRIASPDTSDLPPISASTTLEERGKRQFTFDRRLADIGLRISVAAQERGFQTDTLDKLLETPTRAEFRLHKPVSITIDKLRIVVASTDEARIDYIDLDQAAAMVQRSKRTLEDLRPKMPPPLVKGGHGKKAEWDYAVLRLWLENKFGKKLPDHPFHVRPDRN
jgi:hypothetical protein